MKIIKKICCPVALNIVLWIYSQRLTEYAPDFAGLFGQWTADFDRFNAMCIHWIAMRIAAWLSALWQMLWLEQRFMIYLFIRERNYRKMFVRQYERCVLGVVGYFAAQLLVFAALAVRSYGVSFVCSGFPQMELWAAWINEILGALNFCLLVYGLYCKTRRAEISFLLVLAARMALGCAVGGLSQYLYLCLAVNLFGNMILTVCVMNVAGAGFYDRVQGEA